MPRRDTGVPAKDGVRMRPIGYLRTPFERTEGMPIQPRFARGIAGRIELLPEFEEGLADLDGFSHIIVLYHFHKAAGARLKVTPFLDDTPRGVFATRAPCRPNPIGLSVVRLTGLAGCTLHIKDVDMLDGTPVLDIKPFVPDFDHPSGVRLGWLEGLSGQAGGEGADARFAAEASGADPDGDRGGSEEETCRSTR